MSRAQPAGVGRRIAAGVIDVLLLAGVLAVFTALFGESDTSGSSVSFRLTGLPFLLYALLALAYYFLLEVRGGRTLGKVALGLRVVRTDGTRASGGAIATRTLLRLVDGLLVYLVGLVCVLATGERRQRIGDLAADTTVVRD